MTDRAPLRIAVIGRDGQLARCLAACDGPRHRIACFGRDTSGLMRPEAMHHVAAWSQADVIVNTAAFTAVDRAEDEPGLAEALNAAAAGQLAAHAHAVGAPLIHVSTDYVFDGTLTRPYVEDDPIAPLGIYGRTKADGEARVRAATDNHVILRAAWLYSAHGSNFVKTMLRVGRTRDAVRVVDDQVGSPTGADDLARLIVTIAERIATAPGNAHLRGTFHAAGPTFATWADVAAATFAAAASHGRAPVRVERITTADYPTRARRPANSRLDGARLARVFGLHLPDWRTSLPDVVARILAEDDQEPRS